MSKKGNDTPATTTSIQKVELPAWVEAAGQNNYAQAQNVSANLMGPYTGNTVAGMNGDHAAAFQGVRDTMGMTQPAMNTALNTLKGVQGYQGQSVTAGQFDPAKLGKYMSPYTNNVINAAGAVERQNLAQNLNTIGDAATQQGAFGGSRQAITGGVAQSQAAMNMANLTANLQNQNFAQAQAAMAADQNRALQGDMANQQNGMEAAKLRALAAASGAGVAQQAQQSQLQGAAALQAVGDAQRGYQQDLLNQGYSRYMAARQQPIDQLNLLQYGLGVTPYGSTTSGTTTQYGGQQGQNGIGSVLGGIGSMMGSIMPMLGLLSDEDTKTDVVKLGKDPQTGVEMAAYRYKGDPKSYPKVVGPASAQQMERAVPGSTTAAPDGKRVIRSNFLSGPAAPNNRAPVKTHTDKKPGPKATAKLTPAKPNSFLRGKH